MLRLPQNEQNENTSILALLSRDSLSDEDIARIKVLLDQAVEITELDEKNQTAIEVAVKKCHWQVVLLIAQNRKTDAEDRAGFGKALLQVLTFFDGGTLAINLTEQLVAALLDAGASPYERDTKGQLCAEKAIRRDDGRIVKLFFNHGVDPWERYLLDHNSIIEQALTASHAPVVKAILDNETSESLRSKFKNCRIVLNSIFSQIINNASRIKHDLDHFNYCTIRSPELDRDVIEKLLQAGIPADKELMAEFVKIVFFCGYTSIMSVLVEQDIRPENISSLGINDKTVSYFIAVLEKFAAQHAAMGEEQYNYYKNIVESVLFQEAFESTEVIDSTICKKFYERLVYFLLTQSTVLFDRPVLGHVLALTLCVSLISMRQDEQETEYFSELKKHCYAVLFEEKMTEQEIDAARNRLLRLEQKMAELKPYNDRLFALVKELGKTYQERRQELEDKIVKAHADQKRLLDVKRETAMLRAERHKLVKMIQKLQKLQASMLSERIVLQLENLRERLSLTEVRLLHINNEYEMLNAAKNPEQLAKEMADLETDKDRLVKLENEIEICRAARNAKDRELSDAYKIEPLELNEMAYSPMQHPYVPAKRSAVKSADKEKRSELLQVLQDFFDSPSISDSGFNELGAICEVEEDYTQSLKYSLTAAESGNEESIKRLGRIYNRNECRDDKELYRYAAQCAHLGLGCEKDVDKAIVILAEGIKLGSESCVDYLNKKIVKDDTLTTQTRMRLAQMCLNGSLGTVDHRRAAKFAFTNKSVNNDPLTPEQVNLLSDPAVRKNIDWSFMNIILDKHADQLSDSVLVDMARTDESLYVKGCFIRHRHLYSRIPFDVGLKIISDKNVIECYPCLDYQIYLMENDPYDAGVKQQVCDPHALEKYEEADKKRYYLTCALVYLANNKKYTHGMRAAIYDSYRTHGDAVLRRMKVKNREEIRELARIFRSIVVERGEAKRQALWPIAAGAPLSLTMAEQLYNMSSYGWYGSDAADNLITDLCNYNIDQTDEDYYHSLKAKLRANVFVWVRKTIAACGSENEKKRIADEFQRSEIISGLFYTRTRGKLDQSKKLLFSLLGVNAGIDLSRALEQLFTRFINGDDIAKKILFMYIMAKQGNYREMMLRMAIYYLNLGQERLSRLSAALAFDNEFVTHLDDITVPLYLQLCNFLSKEYKISLLVNNIDMLASRCKALARTDDDIAVELLRRPVLRSRFDIITMLTIFTTLRVSTGLSALEKAEFLQYCIELNPNETCVYLHRISGITPVIQALTPVNAAAATRLDAIWTIVEYVNTRHFTSEFAAKTVATDISGIMDTIAIIEIKSNFPGLTQLLRFFQHAMQRCGWELQTRYLPVSFDTAALLYTALSQHYLYPNKNEVLSIVRSSALMTLIADVDAAEGNERKAVILARAMKHPLFGKVEKGDSIALRETTAAFMFAEISAKYSGSNKPVVLGIIRDAAMADFRASNQTRDLAEIKRRKKQDLYRHHLGLSFFGVNDTDAVTELKKMKKSADKSGVKPKNP